VNLVSVQPPLQLGVLLGQRQYLPPFWVERDAPLVAAHVAVVVVFVVVVAQSSEIVNVLPELHLAQLP